MTMVNNFEEGTVAGTALHYGDFIVIAVYFVFVLVVGLWTSTKNRGSAGGYFLAGRNMNWIPVGASLFASNIGSIHFVGLAGSAAAGGIAIGLYELNALYIMLLLGYIFLPVYMSSGVFTMPEYLKYRFGGQRIQILLAVLALLVYIFTKISADLYAGAIFIEQSMKLDLYGAVLLLLAVACVFTVTGGLTAVIWTDFVQTVLMIIGGLVLMILSFIEVGGLGGLEDKYGRAIPNTTLHSNTTCGYPREDYMHFFRDPVKGDMPWPGLLGISINSVWYWCSDQVIVQRALAAKNYDHAKAGTILCGYMKILPLFLLVFPGMIARVLFPDTVGCADPDICQQVCNSRSGCSNIAYPTLVIKLMPPGARGLMLAVMMAALMSSLTSIFNSSSTIFALDIWTRIRKKASELEVMIVGRIFVVILVIISILWVPVIRASEGSDLYVYIQEISSFMQPPICCIFLLGLFWERLNEKGAFFGMLIGMGVGLIRFIVEYSYSVPLCGEDRPDLRPAIIKNFHYLYFSPFLFFLTGISAIVISLLTKPIDKRCLERLTWWTRHSTKPRLDIDKMSDVSLEKDDKKEALPLSDVASNSTSGYHDDQDYEHEGDDLVKKKEMDNNTNKHHRHNIDSHGEPREPNKLLNDQETAKLSNDNDLDPEVTIEPKHTEQIVPSSASIPRKVFNWVCGIDQNKDQLASHEVVKLDQLSIIEKRPWKIISNISAVVLMIAAVFQLAFFA